MNAKPVEFVRRIGLHPHANGQETTSSPGCPDIWELSDGTFAVIGRDQTSALDAILPADASRGPDEKIVVVDRHILLNARKFIPEQ